MRGPGVAQPGIGASRPQVIQIALVGIGLPFKRDVMVGVAAHEEPDDPLDEVGDIEEDEEHLTLLSRVDALMVHHLVAQVHAMVDKKHSQQIDCRETVER